MFKTLFATFLLSSCVSVPSVTYNAPKLAVQNSSLKGNYCFNDTFGNISDLPNAVGFTFVFENGTGSYLVPMAFNDDEPYWLNSLTFMRANTNYISLNVNYYDLGGTSHTWSQNLYNGSILSDDIDSGYEGFHFNVKQSYYPSNTNTPLSVQMSVFNWFFNSNGNTYVETYSGYYTFSSTTTFGNSFFHVDGAMVYNENLYYYMYPSTNSMVFGYNVAPDGQPFRLINLPVNTSSPNIIYFSDVMFNSHTKTVLETYGVFNYVVTPVNYDLGDLLFDIVDTPVKFLSDLFSFELFGLEFFVAFCSVVTVVMMVFVLRKIV